MNSQAIRILYEYNAWANSRILDTAAQLGQEQLLAAGGASYDSIRDTLVHIVSAQGLWLSRWRSDSSFRALNAMEFLDVDAIRARWEGIERDTQEFISTFNDTDLARIIEYVNDKGETWAYPLWQQLVHQVNHATQHRSEAAMLLTQWGYSPGQLDFLIYIDLQDV